jgi:hypothetical protein
MLRTGGNVGEDFLIKELDSLAIQVPAEFRQKQINEIRKACREKLFENAVVVHLTGVWGTSVFTQQ